MAVGSAHHTIGGDKLVLERRRGLEHERDDLLGINGETPFVRQVNPTGDRVLEVGHDARHRVAVRIKRRAAGGKIRVDRVESRPTEVFGGAIPVEFGRVTHPHAAKFTYAGNPWYRRRWSRWNARRRSGWFRQSLIVRRPAPCA